MRPLRAVVFVATCLMLQIGLGRIFPAGYRWVDLMLIPVVWYAIVGSQRSAMLVGCAAGLMQDAWFHAGAFGLNGFKKTLLGWGLGGLGARFDLTQPPGRFASGAVLALSDDLIDLGLRRMLNKQIEAPTALGLAGRAVITGLVVTVAFVVVERLMRATGERDGLARRI